MAVTDFRQIAEQNIFPGESGGDYNALFGFSNRDGGRYSGTRLTDMTVNQALDFSQPSGDYGQWVRGQVGRVATPMGAYQVVGTTLRAAQQGLGLTGDELMTEGLQDRIGEWIYQEQGPGAWAGWRGNTGGGTRASGSARLSTSGAPTGGILSEGNQMAQPQQGLLASLGIQRRDPNAQGETAQPFYNRRSFGDTMARIAPALGRMGVMGLEGPAQAALDARNQRQGDERAQALQDQQRNATLEWMAGQPNGQQWVEMAQAVGIPETLRAMPAQAGAGDPATVQSSVNLEDGTTVMVMNDGSRRVLSPTGEVVEGQAAADAIRVAREVEVANQQAIYAARTIGTNVAQADTIGPAVAAAEVASASVGYGIDAFTSYGKLQTSLGNIDEAIRAIDGGAQSGLVYNMLPSVTEASASLENSMNRMGLDVIGAVTFGALSEGEMRLAMSTAVPQNLSPPELRDWLVRRRAAQANAAATMQNAAEFLTTPGPGHTINDWIARNRAAEGGTPSAPTGATPEPAGGPDLTTMSVEELEAIAGGGQ